TDRSWPGASLPNLSANFYPFWVAWPWGTGSISVIWPFTLCNGAWVNTNTDRHNCGACGQDCIMKRATTIHLPGFTAEASLYATKGSYRTVSAAMPPNVEGQVLGRFGPIFSAPGASLPNLSANFYP